MKTDEQEKFSPETLYRMMRQWLWVACGALFIMLLVGNVLIWHRALQPESQVVSGICKNSTAGFETITSTAAETLRGISELSTVRNLLREHERGFADVSKNAYRRSTMKTEARWKEFSERELIVRDVLDNQAGRFFRQLCTTDLRFHQIVLTDAEGRLLAAAAKPRHYDYYNTDWWRTVSTGYINQVVSLGFSDDGQLSLAFVSADDSDEGAIQVILRADINIVDVFKQLPINPADSDIGVSVIGKKAICLVGLPDILVALLEDKGSLERILQRGSGHMGGQDVVARAVRGDVVWDNRQWIVAAGPRVAAPLWGLIVACVVSTISIIVMVAVYIYARKKQQQNFITPLHNRLEAGDWVLRNALIRSPSSRAADTAERRDGYIVNVQEQLDEWMSTYEQDFKDNVQASTAEMQHDLNLARDFQRAILERPYPRIPDIYVKGRLRLEFAHCYQPASALGGDFFNILKLGRSSAGVFIADVMGHGTRSALITSMLRTLIGDLTSQGRNAPHFLSEMNKQFFALLKNVPSPLFASAFYFVADTTARVATYSTAGHPSPYHIRRHVGHISRLNCPQPRGAALGAIPNEEFTGGHCRLIPDDVFLFYTDGVYEAFNKDREEFGIARMEKAIRKCMYGSAREIVDGLMHEVDVFVGEEPMADDVCIIAVEVTTRSPGEEVVRPIDE